MLHSHANKLIQDFTFSEVPLYVVSLQVIEKNNTKNCTKLYKCKQGFLYSDKCLHSS